MAPELSCEIDEASITHIIDIVYVLGSVYLSKSADFCTRQNTILHSLIIPHSKLIFKNSQRLTATQRTLSREAITIIEGVSVIVREWTSSSATSHPQSAPETGQPTAVDAVEPKVI